MKSILLFVLFATISFASLPDARNHEEMVRSINEANLGWTASDTYAKSMDYDAWRASMKSYHHSMDYRRQHAHVEPKENLQNVVLPDSFDLRSQYPSSTSIPYIQNQLQCGSCWAFATNGAAADRLYIHTSGASNIVPAPQLSLDCDKTCYTALQGGCNSGCDGGFVDLAYKSFMTRGFIGSGCKAFRNSAGTCTATCDDGVTPVPTSFKASGYGWLPSEEAIMMDIYLYGSVSVTFDVYDDFQYYSRGVYSHTAKKGENEPTSHAVRIIGWGITSGVKYWLVANSWGTSWGEDGFFRMIRGTNNCQFEEDAWGLYFALPLPDPRPTCVYESQWSANVFSGSCVPVTPAVMTTCKRFIGDGYQTCNFWSPDVADGVAGSNIDASLPDACRDMRASVMCALFLPRCTAGDATATVSTSTVYPGLPLCRNICEAYNTACSGYASPLSCTGRPTTNCTGEMPRAASPATRLHGGIALIFAIILVMAL